MELRPEHVRSTANVFGLPLACQYGIGAGPSFGAWRELAVHVMTTNWVLTGQHPGFPLMYHWRVVPDTPPPLPEELADVEKVVAYWGGSPQVRHRLEALRRAPASLLLFLEYVPHTLHTWLTRNCRPATRRPTAPWSWWSGSCSAAITFMNARGLLHFDAHFENILTDGDRLYFADYGLALSSGFDLTTAEQAFFDTHLTYDRAYALGYLVNWLIAALHGHARTEREALIRACAAGAEPPAAPPAARSAIARHVRLASVVTEFLGAPARLPGRPLPVGGDQRPDLARRVEAVKLGLTASTRGVRGRKR